MKARDFVSDAVAIATYPGLDTVASLLEPYCRKTDPRSALMLLGLRWKEQSLNQTVGNLEVLWSQVREKVAERGVFLSQQPPTADALRHMRQRGREDADHDRDLGHRCAVRFTAGQVEPVRAMGFLRSPSASLDGFGIAAPDRWNTVHGDGTVFRALSDVHRDQDGVVHGSSARSEDKARFTERHHGKPSGEGAAGIPVAAIGVAAGDGGPRAILGVRGYQDRNEIAQAIDLFEVAVENFGNGVQFFAYDRLLGGSNLVEIARRGVVPIVDMTQPPKHHRPLSLKISDDMAALLGRAGDPLKRVVRCPIKSVTHHGPHGMCTHKLWAVNGSLVDAGPFDEAPTLDSNAAQLISVRRRASERSDFDLIGRYRVWCRHGSFSTEINYCAPRDSYLDSYSSTQENVLAVLRPVSSTDDLLDVRGWRSSAENTFSHLKQFSSRSGRAHSLDPDDFLLDLVGAACWVNAVNYDEFVTRATTAGKHRSIHRLRSIREKTRTEGDFEPVVARQRGRLSHPQR